MFEEEYVPIEFCRNIVEIRGNSHQIVPYMSLVLGIKPLMDDWIPRSILQPFIEVCRSYGLHVKADAIHYPIPPDRLPPEVLGREYITTTSAFGFPVNTDLEASVHVFISKDRERLKRGMWYPVVIRNRIIEPPRIDVLKYGFDLGYPECCVDFFRRFNNWNCYNFLYEIYKNSKGPYHYFCNPLTKDFIYSYIYHMPCSFNCQKTIELVAKLRREMKKREPEFVEAIDRHQLLPFLVFFERKFYAFSGFIQDQRLYYSQVFFPDSWGPGREYLDILRCGDSLHIEDGNVYVYKGRKPVTIIQLKYRDSVPEYPFLIQFEEF